MEDFQPQSLQELTMLEVKIHMIQFYLQAVVFPETNEEVLKF